MPADKREQVEKLLQDPKHNEQGPCYCSMCNCGLHKCPNRIVRCKYPGQLKTSYQQDYIPRDMYSSGNQFNPNTYRRIPPSYKMESGSTYKVINDEIT